jgi:hypothetical protein
VLAAIAIGGIRIGIKTLRKIERQTAATEKAAEAALLNAQAVINSERAWIVAELHPIAYLSTEKKWYHSVGNMLVPLTIGEINKGEHLRHILKLTNMGRTPAHILGFHIAYSLLPKNVVLPEASLGETVEIYEFDRFIAGGQSTEISDNPIDVNGYINSSNSIEVIKAIRESKCTALFHGLVKYQHIFSDVIQREPFIYTYSVTDDGLQRNRPPRDHP